MTLFELGKINVNERIKYKLSDDMINELLDRHIKGDNGVADVVIDKITDCNSIYSAYKIGGDIIVIKTNWKENITIIDLLC